MRYWRWWWGIVIVSMFALSGFWWYLQFRVQNTVESFGAFTYVELQRQLSVVWICILEDQQGKPHDDGISTSDQFDILLQKTRIVLEQPTFEKLKLDNQENLSEIIGRLRQMDVNRIKTPEGLAVIYAAQPILLATVKDVMEWENREINRYLSWVKMFVLLLLFILPVVGWLIWNYNHLKPMKQLLEVLAREEARKSAMLQVALDGIISIDAHGNIVEFNPAAEVIFGYRREEVLGRSLADTIMPPSLSQAQTQGMERYLETGIPKVLNQRIELQGQDSGGREFPLEIAIAPLSSGEDQYFIAYLRDISERKRVEGDLLNRQQQLDTFFDLSPDGLMLWNSQGLVLKCNPALGRLLGLPMEVLFGITMNQLDLLIQERHDPQHNYTPLTHANIERVDTLSLVNPQRVLQRVTRLLPNGGQVMYFRDLTAEKLLERHQHQFFSTVAHELRTPLSAVYGFSELLATQELDKATQKQMLDVVFKQTERLVRLLGDLLELTRLEVRAQRDFQFKDQPLMQLIEQAIQGYVAPNAQPRVRLELSTPLPDVNADALRFVQALGNVLNNAIKYSSGSVEISSQEVGDRIGLVIQDHGAGMTHAQLSRVFERFYRANPNSDVSGTGLGMSLVKEIIELHGGQIELHSQVGVGTQVYLWLPKSDKA